MSSDLNDPNARRAGLMHDTINDISTVMSIAQNCLMNQELSPEIQADLKRLVQTMRHVSDNIKHLAEILDEEA
jgi:hypothetical protein